MKVSFAHLADYNIPVFNLLSCMFGQENVMIAPKTSKKTLELGAQLAPDFVCVPFKYNLGNFCEALNAGADVIFQAGGGCRFGFYGELQEQILKDAGYEFAFEGIFSGGDIGLKDVHKVCKKYGSDISLFKLARAFLRAAATTYYMDKMDFFVRKNIGFEVQKGSFEKLRSEFLAQLKGDKSVARIFCIYKRIMRRARKIELDKRCCFNVGVVGELYTLMEPFANYFLEKELAKNNVCISRYINATFLLFLKKRRRNKILREASPYAEFHLGADGTDSVARALELAKKGVDGIIHLKPFGCTPEVNAMPILMKISEDFCVPIVYFSFDAQTSETGVKTRLEAFFDMLKMQKSLREREATKREESVLGG